MRINNRITDRVLSVSPKKIEEKVLSSNIDKIDLSGTSAMDEEFKKTLNLSKSIVRAESGILQDESVAEGNLDPELLKESTDKVTKKFTTSLDMEGYMIPANEGKIKHICLTAGGFLRQNYIDAMKIFIKKMPSAKFTILCSNENIKKSIDKTLDEMKHHGEVENPERINVINSNVNYSIWSQDSALVVGNKVISQDRMWFPGDGDRMVAGEAARVNSELKSEIMEGRFVDGGNQLATEDTIFIGSDAIAFMVRDMKPYPRSFFKKIFDKILGRETEEPSIKPKYQKIADELNIENAEKISKEDLAKLMLEKTFPHQKIVIVGYKGKQPAFHIDMAITPLGKTDPATGKKVMVVGDPSMAVTILSDIKNKEPEKYSHYDRELKEKVTWFPEKNPLDKLLKAIKKDKDIQENFDSIAKGFEHDGYKVERVPYLGSSGLSSVPWITYNNAVIDGDNIFVPNFGIPELDDRGNEIYKKYGYNTVAVDMTDVSSLKGAINCITKVLEREYS